MRTLVRFHKLGITNDTERQRRMDLATVLLLTVRGIPSIFYGDEQYLARYKDCEPRRPEFCQVDPEDVNGHDDPYNRVGMTEWSEETAAFKIIAILANLRRQSPAIAQGEYRTLSADQDILVFERRHRQEVVIVVVNRGDAKTIALETGPNVAPDQYSGLLGATGEVNEGNWLTVAPGGRAMLHLGQLSAFVVRSQPPHP
jgi:cyclomaltodextrin glucanotransferase